MSQSPHRGIVCCNRLQAAGVSHHDALRVSIPVQGESSPATPHIYTDEPYYKEEWSQSPRWGIVLLQTYRRKGWYAERPPILSIPTPGNRLLQPKTGHARPRWHSQSQSPHRGIVSCNCGECPGCLEFLRVSIPGRGNRLLQRTTK